MLGRHFAGLGKLEPAKASKYLAQQQIDSLTSTSGVPVVIEGDAGWFFELTPGCSARSWTIL